VGPRICFKEQPCVLQREAAPHPQDWLYYLADCNLSTRS